MAVTATIRASPTTKPKLAELIIGRALYGFTKKSPAKAGLFILEAEVGIEPAYADLQSAA